MRIAITGGTGFVGRHLARSLAQDGHDVVVIARGKDTRDAEVRSLANIHYEEASVWNRTKLEGCFAHCDAVAHLAGINREIGAQTYQRIHIEGTQNVVDAARHAGARKILMLSFFLARPDCGSSYHESKFAAEEIVRSSGLDFTIVKAGMIYGRGDHMLDHLGHLVHTMPLLATVGLREKPVRPLYIGDLIRIVAAALVDGRLSRQTVPVTGPEELLLSEAFHRVATVVGRRALAIPAPLWFHYAFSWLLERSMKIPLVALAQVRILSEGFQAPAGICDSLPDDLLPKSMFDAAQIRTSLPDPGPFTLRDFRCCLS